MTRQIESIGVVGAGLMGAGIAEVAVASGVPTTLIKATSGDAAPAFEKVARALARRVDKKTMTAEARDQALALLRVSGDRDALIGADLVVESIVEDLGEKRSLFHDLGQRLGERPVLASNTSTLRLRDLVAPGYGDRLVGMHFFSPVPVMSLVELSTLADTQADVAPACRALLERMGKTAVPVVDSAGFVVNRLLVPYLIGAVAAYEQRLASAADIDTAMKLGCNHPIGPLALCDLIGLDIVLAMSKLLYREFGSDRFRPPSILRRMVHDGMLGRKAKRGFYDYNSHPATENRALLALIDPHGEEAELESAA